MIFNSFIITQMEIRTFIIFIISICFINSFPIDRDQEAYMKDMNKVLSDMSIVNKEVITREEFQNVVMRLLGNGVGKTTPETEDIFNKVCLLIDEYLPEGDVPVKSIPQILELRRLSDLYLEVLGRMEASFDGSFDPSTDGYGINETFVKETPKEEINSDL